MIGKKIFILSKNNYDVVLYLIGILFKLLNLGKTITVLFKYTIICVQDIQNIQKGE